MKNRPRRKKSKVHRHLKKSGKVARRASPKRQQRKPQPERRREFFDPVFAGAAKQLTTEEAGGGGVGESSGEGGPPDLGSAPTKCFCGLPAPQLPPCPNCGAFMFQSDSNTWKCPNCGHVAPVGKTAV